MRNAYALLGLSFLIVFTGAYLLFERAQAPEKITDVIDEVKQTNGMKLTSPAFENNGTIPVIYTCDGDNINPELHISDVPEGTESLILVMDDPDIPEEIRHANGIEKFNHWVIYNLPADTNIIPAGGTIGTTAQNSSGNTAYTGPCPPAQYKPTEHRYIFRLYAMPNRINFIKVPTLDEVESIAQAESIEKAKLIGKYDRTNN